MWDAVKSRRAKVAALIWGKRFDGSRIQSLFGRRDHHQISQRVDKSEVRCEKKNTIPLQKVSAIIELRIKHTQQVFTSNL